MKQIYSVKHKKTNTKILYTNYFYFCDYLKMVIQYLTTVSNYSSAKTGFPVPGIHSGCLSSTFCSLTSNPNSPHRSWGGALSGLCLLSMGTALFSEDSAHPPQGFPLRSFVLTSIAQCKGCFFWALLVTTDPLTVSWHTL